MPIASEPGPLNIGCRIGPGQGSRAAGPEVERGFLLRAQSEGDRIEFLAAQAGDWLADFLGQARRPLEAAKDEAATDKPARAAQRKTQAKPKAKAPAKRAAAGAKRAGESKRGAEGASAKGRAAKSGSRARPNRSRTPKQPGRR